MTSKQQANLIAFSIGSIVFTIVFYRAYSLSMTFDESATTAVLSASYKDILFSPSFFQSANNHVLNSVLMKISASLFGTSEIALRLPNVLSYLLYFASSWIVSWQCSNRTYIRISSLILLNAILYQLDFFSLARGYGLANAFELASIASLMWYFNHLKKRFVFVSFLFASAAAYSNFTWLNFYLGLWITYNAMHFIKANNAKMYFKECWLNNLIPALFAIILITLSYIPISNLMRQNEFRWGANGWFDSQHTFAKDLLYHNNFVLAVVTQIALILVALIAIRICFLAIRKRLQIDNETQNLLIATLLLFSIIFITVLQRNLLNTMYMDGRKACMYFSIVILVLIGVLQYYSLLKSIHIKRISILLALCSILNFIYKIDLHSIREWWFDENSKQVAYYIRSHRINDDNSIALNWKFYESFQFYNSFQLNNGINKITKLNEVENAISYAYYYVIGEEIANVDPIYQPIFRLGWDRILLQKDSIAYQKKLNAIVGNVITQGNNQALLKIAEDSLKRERQRFNWLEMPINQLK